MTLDLLKQAIGSRSPISFEYNKEGKTPGQRVGNPHAVFIMRRKDGTETPKVHIVQTDGVSDSEQPFPSFRMFDLDELSEILIQESGSPFPIHPDYNPKWEGYQFVIAKV